MQQRDGDDFELQSPEAAITPEEDAVSIDAVTALRAAFVEDSVAMRAIRRAGRVAHRRRAEEALEQAPLYPRPKVGAMGATPISTRPTTDAHRPPTTA